MRDTDKLDISFEATRKLVIAKEKETGIYVEGFYTEFFEVSKSGKSYKMQEDDRFIYVARSACITDGNGYLFVPFKAIKSALDFANANGIYEYVGG